MPLSAGTRLGPYEILAPLGRGGMGEVYRARDTRLGRFVAIKLLCETFGADVHAALLREARAAAALNHPNICTIHEIGDADGHMFIVMEHVEGKSMLQLVAEGLEHSSVIAYAKQIADALAHAHERGIIHRDLKSANLMVTADGRVKVLDFGIAKLTGDVASQMMTAPATASGMVSGTPAYMAPEVLRGGPADPRSDIWAIGIVLYEMAAGRRPFDGDTAFDVSAAILRDKPPALARNVPALLRSVVTRCLAKDPAERYQQACEIRTALEAAATRPVRVTPDPAATAKPRARKARAHNAPTERIRSLAVLPLDNVSRDPEQDYFADGLTEELISAIARIDGLRVSSRMAIMRYKRTTKAAADIVRELNVDALVGGTVRRTDDRVRIFVQLIDPSNDSYVWTSNFDEDLRDIHLLESTIAQGIADQVALTITRSDRPRRAPNPEAVVEYLRGRHFARQLTSDGLRKAGESFERATAIDAGYALPFAALAEVYVLQSLSRDAVRAVDVLPRARAAADRALSIDPALAEPHVALGLVSMYFDWDLPSAERSFKEALRLNPNSVDALKWYSGLLIWLDARCDEARELIGRAALLDPVDPWILMQTVWAYNFDRDFASGVEHARRLVSSHPLYGMGHYALAASLIGLARGDEAVASVKRAIELDGTSASYVALLGMANALSGDKTAALDCLAQLDALERAGADVAAWKLHVHAALRDADAVIASLEQTIAQRGTAAILVFTTPYVDFVRSDPRFVALLENNGLAYLTKR